MDIVYVVIVSPAPVPLSGVYGVFRNRQVANDAVTVAMNRWDAARGFSVPSDPGGGRPDRWIQTARGVWTNGSAVIAIEDHPVEEAV